MNWSKCQVDQKAASWVKMFLVECWGENWESIKKQIVRSNSIKMLKFEKKMWYRSKYSNLGVNCQIDETVPNSEKRRGVNENVKLSEIWRNPLKTWSVDQNAVSWVKMFLVKCWGENRESIKMLIVRTNSIKMLKSEKKIWYWLKY